MSDKTGTFDPAKYLRQIKTKNGMADYLDVKFRLLWLRAEHPEAVIETEMMVHMEHEAIFRAKVTLPSGAAATGWGSETRADFPSGHLEKAETKALGRALAALGFGIQFVGDELDEGERIVDSPTPPRPAARPSAPVAAPAAPQRTGAPAPAPATAKPADWNDVWRLAKSMDIHDREALARALGGNPATMDPGTILVELRAIAQRQPAGIAG